MRLIKVTAFKSICMPKKATGTTITFWGSATIRVRTRRRGRLGPAQSSITLSHPATAAGQELGAAAQGTSSGKRSSFPMGWSRLRSQRKWWLLQGSLKMLATEVNTTAPAKMPLIKEAETNFRQWMKCDIQVIPPARCPKARMMPRILVGVYTRILRSTAETNISTTSSWVLQIIWCLSHECFISQTWILAAAQARTSMEKPQDRTTKRIGYPIWTSTRMTSCKWHMEIPLVRLKVAAWTYFTGRVETDGACVSGTKGIVQQQALALCWHLPTEDGDRSFKVIQWWQQHRRLESSRTPAKGMVRHWPLIRIEEQLLIMTTRSEARTSSSSQIWMEALPALELLEVWAVRAKNCTIWCLNPTSLSRSCKISSLQTLGQTTYSRLRATEISLLMIWIIPLVIWTKLMVQVKSATSTASTHIIAPSIAHSMLRQLQGWMTMLPRSQPLAHCRCPNRSIKTIS